MTDVESDSQELLREIREFVLQLDGPLEDDRHEERRKSKRYHFRKNIAAIPLDEKLSPCGEAMMLTSLDISMHGMGLLAWKPIQCRFLSLTVPIAKDKSVEVNAMVMRCAPTDHFQSRFQVGCKFLA